MEWWFEPRIDHRTVLVKCSRSSGEGEECKKPRILNQGLWNPEKHPIAQVWICGLGASCSTFGCEDGEGERNQSSIPGPLLIFSVTLCEPEYNPCLLVNVKRKLNKRVCVEDPAQLLANRMPSIFGALLPLAHRNYTPTPWIRGPEVTPPGFGWLGFATMLPRLMGTVFRCVENIKPL